MRRKISSTHIPIIGPTGTLSRRVDEKLVLTKIWGHPNSDIVNQARRDAETLFRRGDICWIIDAEDVTGAKADVSGALAALLVKYQASGGSILIAVITNPALKMIFRAVCLSTQVKIHLCETMQEAEFLAGEIQ